MNVGLGIEQLVFTSLPLVSIINDTAVLTGEKNHTALRVLQQRRKRAQQQNVLVAVLPKRYVAFQLN